MTTNSFSGNLGGRAYDRFYDVNTWCPELEAQVGRVLAEHLSGRPARVLDIGVGTGDTSYEALLHCPNIELVAIDLEQQMVEVARERFASEPRITVLQADALEFLKSEEKQSYEAVISGFCLHNIPSDVRAKIIRQIGRVLKSKAIFVSCDKIALDNEVAHRETLDEQIRLFEGFADDPDYRQKWVEHYQFDDQPNLRLREADYRYLLGTNGFWPVSISHRTLMDCLLWATTF